MAGLDVNARLTLDASNFDANMKKSEAAATATGRATAKVARETAAAQATASRYSGDIITAESRKAVQAINAQKAANRELAQVEKLVQRGLLDEAAGADAVAAAYQRKAAAALVAARATAGEQSHNLAPRQAASAVTRGLENGTPGIRAAEMALTRIIPAAALQTAGMVLGFGALAGVVVELGMKLVEAGKQAAEMAKKTTEAFRGIHVEVSSATDELRLHNDQLQNEILKLEHKPQNNLKIALDENIIAVDNLAKRALDATGKVKGLLEANKASFLSQLMGAADTSEVAGSVTSYRNDLSDLAYDKREQTRAGDLKAAAETDKKIQAKKASYNQWLRKQISDRTSTVTAADGTQAAYASVYGNQAPNLAVLRGEHVNMQDEDDQEAAVSTGARLKPQLAALQASKSMGEAQKKADELRFKAMEAHVAEWKTLSVVTIKAQEEYWESVQDSFARGSAQYDAILNKRATLSEEAIARVHQGLEKLRAERKEAAEEATRIAIQVPTALDGINRDTTRAKAELYDAANEQRAQAIRNAARLAETQIGQTSGRSVTQQAAAMAMAAVHTREYGVELDRLQQKQAAVRADSTLAGYEDEREKKIAALERQIEQVQSNRKVQILTDAYQAGPVDSSALVGARDAIDEFTRAAQDSATLMRSVFAGALNSTNEGLVKLLTSRNTQGEHIFGNIGADVARNATAGLLKSAEGKALGVLGFGGNSGPLGTRTNPMYVRSMDAAALSSASDAGSKALATALGRAPAGGIADLAAPAVSSVATAASSAAGGGGGLISKLISSVLPFAGFFANGGDPPPNSMAWVGERGPELVRFGNTRQTVVPNHKLGSASGGGGAGGIHVHVDATGATDPAQVQAAAHRAVMAAAPHIIAAANGKAADDKRRSIGPGR